MNNREDITDDRDDRDHLACETEEDLAALLTDALDAYAEDNDAREPRIRTFRDAGLLTGNEGLVVEIGGAEFQITIVRSR